jgi:hypothetical protein
MNHQHTFKRHGYEDASQHPCCGASAQAGFDPGPGRPGGGQAGMGPGYGQSGGHAGAPYGQPGSNPGYADPGYGNPGYADPGYGASGYGSSGYGSGAVTSDWLHGLSAYLPARHRDQFLMGLVLGAGAAWVLSDEALRAKMIKSGMKLYANIAGGFEELKEQMADIRAEVAAERHADE